MAPEVIFAACGDKFRIVRELGDGSRSHGSRMHYRLCIDDAQLPQPAECTMTRNHLVALHYALTAELARQTQWSPGGARTKSIFQGLPDDL